MGYFNTFLSKAYTAVFINVKPHAAIMLKVRD